MSNTLSEEEQMLAAGYVLGDLTPDEIAQLEQLATDNPALLQEIHALQSSFELIPQGLIKIEPPVQLRQAVQSSSSYGVIATPQPTQSGSRVSHRPRRTRPILKLFAGLAALVALALAADNWRLRHQLSLAEQVRLDRVATILQQPNSRLISLTGTTTDAAGTLLFTPGRWQEVVVSLGNLPPLPPDQIYRMWLALENGEIIYCGAFNTDSEGSVFVRFTPPQTPPTGVKATQLFVTIDASAASPNPSGERVMEGAI